MNSINIYMCGPTLFDYVHIGCYRIFILADIIDKHYSKKGYKVNHGINIMDIDDKIIQNYEKKTNFNVEKYYKSFKKEFEYLHINYPNKETKTSENISEIKKIIDFFLKKELAYIIDSGVYFDLSKISNYGSLSNLNVQNNLNMTKITNKKNNCDPSLWRFSDSKYSYKYLGKNGRPGWDIQCADCCISKLNSKIDYQFAGFNDVTHYENEKVLIENSFNYEGYKSKWILPKYLNFVDDTPYFYMKDYIDKYNRQVIKYAIYSISYSTSFDISERHFNNSEKDIKKLNVFSEKMKLIKNFSLEENNEIKKIIDNFKNIDILFENLKIPAILGNLFKLIKAVYKNDFNISKKQYLDILNLLNYINERLDFII